MQQIACVIRFMSTAWKRCISIQYRITSMDYLPQDKTFDGCKIFAWKDGKQVNGTQRMRYWLTHLQAVVKHYTNPWVTGYQLQGTLEKPTIMLLLQSTATGTAGAAARRAAGAVEASDGSEGAAAADAALPAARLARYSALDPSLGARPYVAQQGFAPGLRGSQLEAWFVNVAAPGAVAEAAAKVAANAELPHVAAFLEMQRSQSLQPPAPALGSGSGSNSSDAASYLSFSSVDYMQLQSSLGQLRSLVHGTEGGDPAPLLAALQAAYVRPPLSVQAGAELGGGSADIDRMDSSQLDASDLSWLLQSVGGPSAPAPALLAAVGAVKPEAAAPSHAPAGGMPAAPAGNDPVAKAAGLGGGGLGPATAAAGDSAGFSLHADHEKAASGTLTVAEPTAAAVAGDSNLQGKRDEAAK